MNKAVIDLGTNTFHLLIAHPDSHAPSSFQVLFEQKIGVRLGADGNMMNKTIGPLAMARALECLEKYVLIAKAYSIMPDMIYAVGTSALRNAGNAADFVEQVRNQTKILVRIIDGNQEFSLVWDGICQTLDLHLQNQTILVIDIGGGSIEMIIGQQKKILWAQSYETGGLRLLEKALFEDPFSIETKARLSAWLRNSWPGLDIALSTYNPTIIVGAAGMFETFAQIYAHQNHKNITGLCRQIPYSFFDLLNNKIAGLNLEARKNIHGMIDLRAQMMPAAMLIMENIFAISGIRKLYVSDYGLCQGLLVSE